MHECRLCLQKVSSLVKSHIYPRALNQPFGTSGEPLAVVTREGVKKSHMGIYESFLCQSCEALFSEPERHFVNFVRQIESGRPIHHLDGKLLARQYTQQQANPRLLRLYANSLLLRAHLTTHDFFRNVKLGTHYERLKSLVLRNEPGSGEDFSLLLLRLTGPAGSTARAPQKTRLGHANGVILAPPRIQLYIKVDQRPLANGLRYGMVTEGQEIIVSHRETSRDDLAHTIALTDPHRDGISRILKRTP